ncbi:MAG: flagellar export chaperone FliS [Desulfobacterales bacterium]|nr:flagellar export chaperone FliS [Desulfobacterales bacterium]MCP4159609.1 flagellar export chaperone FliS [Deltaproteobacteria bacterium]
MNNSGYNAYRHSAGNAVLSKDQILIRLYKGMIKFVSLAKRGIEMKSPKVRGENISKTMAILTELECALDKEAGGELSETLSDLYRYMISRLTVANMENDLEAIDEVEKIITELSDGFSGAALENRKKQSAKSSEEEKKGLSFAV